MVLNKSWIRLALTVIGVIGVPVTSYLSVKCHEKAQEAETKEEKAKCYIPAAVSGLITTASIIGSHRSSSKEIAALTATATYAVANRNKLETELGKYITKDEAKQIKQEVANDTALLQTKAGTFNKPSIEWTGHGPLKVLEGYSGRLFYSSMDKVIEAEQKLSRRFMDGEYVCMNDFYSLLGITQTHFGHQWGWAPSDDYYPRWYEDNPFGFENRMVEDEEGDPMLVIEIFNYPMEAWQEVS